jgi:LPXTG-site transpeptidase (sortase) family protein
LSKGKTQARSTSARLLTLFSTACVLGGVVLLAYYGSSIALAARANDHGIEAFEAARSELQAGGLSATAVGLPTAALDFDAVPDQSDWSEKRINDFDALRNAGGMEEVPAGVMRIPSVNLVLPLFEGTGEHNLTRGAGIIENTDELGGNGNTGLAAHRDGYFRSLQDVNIGDEIQVDTLEATLRYRISDIFIVDPSDVHVLDRGERGQITLVTCYPFYFVGSAPQRYIVQADLL